MKSLKLILTAGALLAAGIASAAGPLYLHEAEKPLWWNTSNGSIPVYTDSGEAFAFDFDGVTPFVTVERANEITQFAFDQWNDVATSTFQADIAGTIESVTGIADVTGANAADIYTVQNGYGFFVNYDTDGTILSDFFGVGEGVLGIAFPEWADETTGEILEATAVLNGVAIWEEDVNGDQIAGVFTHEFGHAINLSHSQTNGDAFYANSNDQRLGGPRHCGPYEPRTSLEQIETMFPFIAIYQAGPGEAQSTVNLTDDRVAISNLYPTSDYKSSLGSISGVLRLKDGATPYSGINVIARNVNNWWGDAVSAMSGDQTQGLIGPDGRFTINGLTPGESYVLYISDIWAGGYPTTPQPMVSQPEFWNAAESNNPATDDICDATPIVAEAGVTKIADITFNGYNDGVQYSPLVSALATDLSKNGKVSAGQSGSTAFLWDEIHGFKIFPEYVKAGSVQTNRDGHILNVQYDADGNGIGQASLLQLQGNSGKFTITPLGDLNGDSCGGSGVSGTNSTYGWDVDDNAHTVVGLAYIDKNDDGNCNVASLRELLPFIWTDDNKGGMRLLDHENPPSPSRWLRAHKVSGNGKVVLGNNGGSIAVAWVNEGPLVDLYNGPYRGREAIAINQDGSRVALETFGFGPVIWHPYTDTYTEIGSLRWCDDIPYFNVRFGFLCDSGYTHEDLVDVFGPPSIVPTDMNDEGTMITGRAGDPTSGFVGVMWIEGLGWLTLDKFFYAQGVAEAFDFPMDNPFALDGKGNTMLGGLAGAQVTFRVDMSEVYVCEDGLSVATQFPSATLARIADGAELGRCEFLN